MTVVSAAELATWTPISLNLEEATPSVDWGDFRSLRFTEPFFDETVARWAAQDPRPAAVRTSLDALVALDQAPSLEPSGLIFHLSRCGSTLLTRLLRQIPGVVVVSEPDIVNQLLMADSALIEKDARVQLLRLVTRALGRQRFGDERHYVVKLSSWNIRRLELFRCAFPSTPMVWLQREPVDVIMSLLTKAPAWQRWREQPELAAAIFDIGRSELVSLGPAEFYARALERLLQAALAAPPRAMTAFDYSELPDVAWLKVTSRFNIAANADDFARMHLEAQLYSKDVRPRRFERKASPLVPELIRRLAADRLDGLYRALNEPKASTAVLPRSDAARS